VNSQRDILTAGTISQLFDRAQQDSGPPGLDNVIHFIRSERTTDGGN